MPRPDAPIHLPQQLPGLMAALLSVQSMIDAAMPVRTLKHLVVLRASQINRCDYCMKLHAEQARADGESSERLDRLAGWRDAPGFTAVERAALAWTEALTGLEPHADYGPLRAGLREHLGEAQVASLTAAVAMINLWNRIQVANH